MHRHFEGQWPKQKGALRGWVLVNINYPVVTNIHYQSKLFEEFLFDFLFEDFFKKPLLLPNPSHILICCSINIYYYY